MPKAPKFPEGIRLYKDTDGVSIYWRVSLGVKFVGKGNKARKKAFSSHAAAVDFIQAEVEKKHGNPEEAKKLQMTEAEVLDAKYALHKLKGRASLVEAAEAWLKHVEPFKTAPTVENAIKTLGESKKKEELGDRHLRELAAKLNRFFRGVKTKKISDVTREDVEAARDAMDANNKPASASQRIKRLRYAAILINFAEERGWIDPLRSPLRGVNAPKLIPDPVHVLSPKEVAMLLWTAQQSMPGMVVPLAIKIFSGVRNPELFALRWEWIQKKAIKVPAAFTKTGRMRSVSIHTTLSEWLKPAGKGLIFSLAPGVKDREAAWLDHLQELRKLAGFDTWHQNCLRHCFGSYHYQRERNENTTAFEMGNSPGVIRRHYVDAVDEEDCKLFWRMVPVFAEPYAQQKEDSSGSESEDQKDAPEPEPE